MVWWFRSPQALWGCKGEMELSVDLCVSGRSSNAFWTFKRGQAKSKPQDHQKSDKDEKEDVNEILSVRVGEEGRKGDGGSGG